jgi:dolichol-phosphate mannosyltransferase
VLPRLLAATGVIIPSMNIVVVVPTFNEAENIEPLVAELLALGLEGLSILVVDDESPDGTGGVADTLAARHPSLVNVMHRHDRHGLGLAYMDGFQAALANGADAIVQMDADFSHSPRYIPKFLEVLPEADVVVGSRYVRGGSLDDQWSWWRRFLSWWANAVYTRLLLGLHVRDGTAGYKMWSRAALQGIDFASIQSNGYIFQVEMAYVCERLGYRIIEVPIHFEDRRIGRSKMSTRVKVEAALRTLEIRWRHHGLRPYDRLAPPAPAT